MSFPKQIKKKLDLVPQKELSARRQELSEYIQKDGTYLPKSVLHADLDRGMLDFVKNDLRLVTAGEVVPTVDRILTTQNWSQFTETWDFTDKDLNAKPPFITVVRQPEVKYGTNPAILYTIPNRRQYHYAIVPTWNGNQKGADVYTIPQPVPVDINYNVKIVCNRMRELNQFNKIVLQKFSSRQAYIFIKGQYVPIVSTNISDESVMELDKRKFYIQNYDFTMLGYLIDEEEFEVKPAISRVVQLFETDVSNRKQRTKKNDDNVDTFKLSMDFPVDVFEFYRNMDYKANLNLINSTNIENYNVFLNGDYFGENVNSLTINTNDLLLVQIIKKISKLENSNLTFECKLV